MLRCIGLGLAMAQLVYLVLWISLVLGAPKGDSPILDFLGSQPLDSLGSLFAGMLWAAVFGGVGGVSAVVCFSLTRRAADQALARSLVRRNQSR